MSIQLNQDGSIVITDPDIRLGSCRWCKVASYDMKVMKDHCKTPEHHENKKKNPSAKPLTEKECLEAEKKTKFSTTNI